MRALERVPDLGEFVSTHAERVEKEEREYLVLTEQLEKALEALDSPKEVQESGASSSQTPDESSEPTLAGLVRAHQGMSPTERVVDILDRLSLASQPLLERIIQSTDKDLDQLLSELDADEAAAATGVRSIEGAGKRDLVLNPNSLPLDRLLRKSAVSPTRALIRGRGRRRAALELEDDPDDEARVREELTRWMERGEKARRQGRKGLMSDTQRKEAARLMEKQHLLAAQDPEATSAKPTTQTNPAEILNMKRMKEITETPATDLSNDNWFTTVPSIGITKPEVHPRTHSIPVALLHFRSYFPHLLDFQTHFVLHSAHLLGIPVSQPAHLPIQRTLVTVLKSPFVHKKAMENWDRKTYKRSVKVWDCDPAVLSGWLAYLERNNVEGVGIRITRWEWAGMDLLEDTGDVNPELREKASPELTGAASNSLGSTGRPAADTISAS